MRHACVERIVLLVRGVKGHAQDYNNAKYSSVRLGIDLSIPPLYCGAKYCRSGSKSDFQRLRTEPGEETPFTRPARHAGKATSNASELLEKSLLLLLLY